MSKLNPNAKAFVPKSATQPQPQPIPQYQQYPQYDYQAGYIVNPLAPQQQYMAPQPTMPTPQKKEAKKKNDEFEKILQEKAKAIQEKKLAEIKKQEKKDEPKKEEAKKEVDAKSPSAEKPKDKEEETKQQQFVEIDEKKTPLSIVFIGHVDSGKSTICGRMMMDMGKVDMRTVEKYKKEATEKNRESWWIAYVMDINEEEKAKGKTVEVGRIYFETPSKRITVFDAPGHSNYVPNMIMGASMADVGILVISAKKGEFESGFAKGGQTTEHIILSKTIGIKKLAIVINKMDEQSVKWDKNRFMEIQKELSPFLIQVGYSPESINWIPISGLLGDNICKPSEFIKWYSGPILMDALDKIDIAIPEITSVVRIPIMDKLKDQGIDLFGKVIKGSIKMGSKLTLMPSKTPVEVTMIFNSDDEPIKFAPCGENIKFKLRGVEEEQMCPRGSVVCSNDSLIPTFDAFEGEVSFLEMPSKMLISEGFKCILHMHTIVEDCTVVKVKGVKGEDGAFKPSKYVKSNSVAHLIISTRIHICGEKYSEMPDMGRFTLRFDNKTIGFGKVLKYKK